MPGRHDEPFRLHSALNNTADTSPVPPIRLVALIMIVAGLGFRITRCRSTFTLPTFSRARPRLGRPARGCAQGGRVHGSRARAGFRAAARLVPRHGIVGESLSEHVPVLFWFLAVVTMSLGNLLALLQDNVRRLLALLQRRPCRLHAHGLATAPFLPTDGGQFDGVAALFSTSSLMESWTTGAFAILSYLDSDTKRVESVDDLAGLGTIARAWRYSWSSSCSA